MELYGYQCDNNPNFNARSGNSFIFANTHHHSKGKPITKDGINQYLKSDALRIELEKLGISNANLSTHSFRKEFGQHLLEEGADVKQIQELLGQSSLEATIRYLSTDDSDKRDLVEMLGRQAAGVNEPVVASGANDELDSAESVNSRILALVERAVMSGADSSVVEALLKGIKSRL